MAFCAVALIPMKASEVGLLLDKQFGQSFNKHSIPGDNGINPITGGAVNPLGVGVRGAYTISNFNVCEISIAATYHPMVKTDWDPTFAGIHMPSKVGNEYFAIGAQADWKTLVNFHLGVDLRQETISSNPGFTMVTVQSPSAPPIGALLIQPGKTTVTRPWMKAGLDFSFPSAATTPFIRLEGSLALKTYSLPAGDANGDDFRRVLAPKYQISLHGGIRF